MAEITRTDCVALILLVLLLVGCAQVTEVAPVQNVPSTPTLAPLTDTPVLTTPSHSPASLPELLDTPNPGPLPETAPVVEALPQEPQEITFQADDGQVLAGRYYPAAVVPAPLVVLMHWAPGDQDEWLAIATWLQNRGGFAEPDPAKPWLDSTWFPPMLDGQSFAVFTFTFRNCEGGCKSFSPSPWLLDARAAMLKARQLEGVDPNSIAAIGASIGADGAVDGCIWLNAAFPDSCLGALSLSPGGYLTIPYHDAVAELGMEAASKPVWCLYAEGDGDSKRACGDSSGENYTPVKYDGSNHGMMLIQPQEEPAPLKLILDFLKVVFAL